MASSMGNADLFRKVRELKLPVGEYALFGSGPLGIRKIRECKDIDLIVVEDLWQKYKYEPGWEHQVTPNGVEHIHSSDGDIEIWHDWLPWYQDVAPFIMGAELIDGLPFVKLEHVIDWKRKYGREKDLRDIEAIEKFLETQKQDQGALRAPLRDRYG